MAGGRKSEEELNDLVDEITVDAYGDDEQLWAFRQVIEDEVAMPADAFVVGEPVTVIEIDYDGNERRGLTARCRREDGSEHIVSASDLVFPEGSKGADYMAAYRTWLGIEPYPKLSCPKKPKAKGEDLDMGKDVDLVVLAVKGNADLLPHPRNGACPYPPPCRLLGGSAGGDRHRDRRAGSGATRAIPTSRARSRPGAPTYPLSASRPLTLEEQGTVGPQGALLGRTRRADRAVGEADHQERPETRILRWSRSSPAEDSDDPDTDPILEAVDLKEAGDHRKARRKLMDLLAADLRCLDAHAHLGNFAFPRDPDTAVRHYDMGVKIGELSLGKDFGGLLPWGCIDNRPFLRCLHGYGLCLWRFGRLRDAEKVFTRMLWLNPDRQPGRAL